ncbi:unnamed protein product [Adineta steineri]|uniref:F-box domain-containing protein n=1 Tax=Adineta steineri TaxID=433720 RepID=A0A815BYH4_9BILA|nr:unnamed protein product [Adineta steineri]CAF1275946.1 unnamed protein product [Adineta steineri]
MSVAHARFENLPNEILMYIFSFMTTKQLYQTFKNVNQRLNELINDTDHFIDLGDYSKSEYRQLVMANDDAFPPHKIVSLIVFDDKNQYSEINRPDPNGWCGTREPVEEITIPFSMITQEQPSIVSLTIKHRVHDIDLVHLLKFLPNLKTLSTTLCMYPKLYEFENCSNLTSLEFDVTGIGLTDIEEYLFKMFPNLSDALIVDFTPAPQIRNFITDKIEEQLGLDINKDGRIGGPGPMSKIEQTTHIDLNHDGIIGGYRPPAGGGLIGKIEQATHIDLNGDGRIGSGIPYHTSQHKH